MGFMDKVKSQASALAEKAQEGARAGQEKLSQVQAKRHSDALLLELGGIVYLDRSGRPQAGGDARAEAIVSELRAFEAEHGAVSVTSAVPQPGETGSYVPGGAGSPVSPASPAPEASQSPPVTSAPTGGGIPTASPGGGIPTASYASDEDQAEPSPESSSTDG